MTQPKLELQIKVYSEVTGTSEEIVSGMLAELLKDIIECEGIENYLDDLKLGKDSKKTIKDRAFAYYMEAYFNE